MTPSFFLGSQEAVSWAVKAWNFLLGEHGFCLDFLAGSAAAAGKGITLTACVQYCVLIADTQSSSSPTGLVF